MSKKKLCILVSEKYLILKHDKILSSLDLIPIMQVQSMYKIHPIKVIELLALSNQINSLLNVFYYAIFSISYDNNSILILSETLNE